MSYESVKLAQAPVIYNRLDQLGFGVNGETVPDLSGNGLDATLAFTGNMATWGYVSPIETDSASREFWGYTAQGGGPPGDYVTLGGSSTISRVNHALMGLGGGKDFTVGEWLRPMDERPTSGNFAMVQKQGTGGTMLGGGATTRIAGFCFDSAATLWIVTDTSFEVVDHLGESFYVVVVRLGDALALYINGTLRGVTTVASGLPTLSNSSPWVIHPSTGLYTNARHDEAEYFTRALSAAEILESYEAALNILDMRGEANIRTTAVLSGTDAPDPIAYPFRHNWSQPVIERFRWRTSVFKPTNGATELTRQRSSLRRQVEYQHLLYDENLRRRFEARSFAGRTTLTQFEPDKVQVAALAAGATAAVFNAQYMDFEVGHRILIYQSDDLYEHQLLTVVGDSGVEWSEPLTRDYVNPWLKPARVARLPLSQEMDAHTDTIGDASTIYEYLPEDEPLSPRRIIPFVPTLTYHSQLHSHLRQRL